MGWDPNAEDRYVDAGNNGCCTPFQSEYSVSIFGYNGNSIYDNLHEQLNLKYPEKQEEEQNGYPRDKS